MPGVDMSTRKQVMPSCLGAAGLVRARQMPQSASLAMVVHTFWPVSDQPPSTRSARVASDARSEPAPGSENSWHHVSSWRSDGAMNCSCWAAVPWAMRVGSTHPATCRCGRRMPAARNSSSITSCSSGPDPRPHGSGQWGQIQPWSARRVFQRDRSSAAMAATAARTASRWASAAAGRSSCSVRRVPATAASSTASRHRAGSPLRE